MAGNFLWAGYQAAAADLTTAASLDSLADGSMVLGTVEVDNTSTKYTHMDVILALGSAAFTATSYAALYLLPAVDGTNYPTNTTGAGYKLAEPNYFIGSIAQHAETAAQRQELTRIEIPPAKFKIAIVNKTGVTWVGSGGNTLQYRPYMMSYT